MGGSSGAGGGPADNPAEREISTGGRARLIFTRVIRLGRLAPRAIAFSASKLPIFFRGCNVLSNLPISEWMGNRAARFWRTGRSHPEYYPFSRRTPPGVVDRFGIPLIS